MWDDVVYTHPVVLEPIVRHLFFSVKRVEVHEALRVWAIANLRDGYYHRGGIPELIETRRCEREMTKGENTGTLAYDLQ